MKNASIKGWQGVQAEVLRRLHERFWKPGDLLPSEADLATEFGCARTTVNRALQAIADEGLLERRRRGGTRVVINPEQRARFNIPVIRLEIEQLQREYGYRLLMQRQKNPPRSVRERMQVGADASIVSLRALHTADGNPYVLEKRWINLSIVPSARGADFSLRSPNEWLVEHVPFNGGDLTLSAQSACEEDAKALACEAGAAVFMAERRTRNAQGATITIVHLVYAPGYQMAIDL